MKVIHLARFCLIDAGPVAEQLLRELNQMQIGAAHLVAPDEHALENAAAIYPDIIVLNAEIFPNPTRPGLIDGFRRTLIDEGGEAADCPVILLKRMPRRSDVYAAVMAGYAAVMPLPTNARLIYRRTAAIMQKSRHAQRRAGEAAMADAYDDE